MWGDRFDRYAETMDVHGWSDTDLIRDELSRLKLHDLGTPHGNAVKNMKLTSQDDGPELLKLAAYELSERKRKYDAWVQSNQSALLFSANPVRCMVRSLNEYYVDLYMFVWTHRRRELHTNQGKAHLVQSILEEFLPWLCKTISIPDRLEVASKRDCISSMYVDMAAARSSDEEPRTCATWKEHDFVVGVWKTFSGTKKGGKPTVKWGFAPLFITEVKTNLDETMYEGAKQAALAAKAHMRPCFYFIVAEKVESKDKHAYSIMGTHIDDVILLRRALRPDWDDRVLWNKDRLGCAAQVRAELENHPMEEAMFRKWLSYVQAALAAEHGNLLRDGCFRPDT